ncbi:MAG: DUF2188 domain-containing protein [Eubacteriales bacterium]
MPWTQKDYPDSMKNLEEPVRNKAIEISNSLIENGYDDDRAIPIAISQAKEWYENRGGDISSDITHHLIPDGDGWVLKPLDGNDRCVFDTKEEAIDKIKDMSKNSAIKVMIHDSKGKFQKVY